jgi:hypothetical protein
MGSQWIFVLLSLELVLSLRLIFPTVATELGTPVSTNDSNPFRMPILPKDKLWRALRLEHVIQYNEAEQCRRSDDPFEIPAILARLAHLRKISQTRSPSLCSKRMDETVPALTSPPMRELASIYRCIAPPLY